MSDNTQKKIAKWILIVLASAFGLFVLGAFYFRMAEDIGHGQATVVLIGSLIVSGLVLWAVTKLSE